jgi:SAM-dependent methyltransferase
MASLHLGCGPRTKLCDVGVDILPGPAVDVVHDLNVHPWPLPNDAFDRVVCIDVIEHLANVVRTMEEIHRIARDGARVEIQVPTLTSRTFFTDPTHVRGFGYRSLDYFVPGKPFHNYGYSPVAFRLTEAKFSRLPSRVFGPLDRLMERFANTFPDLYENRLAFVYPMSALNFELVVVKS